MSALYVNPIEWASNQEGAHLNAGGMKAVFRSDAGILQQEPDNAMNAISKSKLNKTKIIITKKVKQLLDG